MYKDKFVEELGEKRKGPKLKHAEGDMPGLRHRADKEEKRFKFTPSFVLVWIAILIIQGAQLSDIVT